MLAVDLVVFARHHAPSAARVGVWSLVWLGSRWLRRRAVGVAGRRGRLRVPRRLPARALPVARQHLRLRGHLRLLRRARGACSRGCSRGASRWRSCCALVFILAGAALLDSFHATFYAFGALLLFTAYKLARHDDTEIEPEHNPALRILRKRVADDADYHGDRLSVREAGKRVATPLVAVLRRRRDDGHHLRRRLDPGDLRRHRGAVRRLRRQRVRDARPARALLRARRG